MLLRKLACFEAGREPKCRLLQIVLRIAVIHSLCQYLLSHFHRFVWRYTRETMSTEADRCKPSGRERQGECQVRHSMKTDRSQHPSPCLNATSGIGDVHDDDVYTAEHTLHVLITPLAMALLEDMMSIIAFCATLIVTALSIYASLVSWATLGTVLPVYIRGDASAWPAIDILCLCIFAGMSFILVAWGIPALRERPGRLTLPKEECAPRCQLSTSAERSKPACESCSRCDRHVSAGGLYQRRLPARPGLTGVNSTGAPGSWEGRRRGRRSRGASASLQARSGRVQPHCRQAEDCILIVAWARPFSQISASQTASERLQSAVMEAERLCWGSEHGFRGLKRASEST